jgi:PPK2 family polyphosphate:nucleotide phosphotransferase
MLQEKVLKLFRVDNRKKFKLADHKPGWNQAPEFEDFGKDAVKERAQEVLAQNLADLASAQEVLAADGRFSVLIVLQAMDAAGKDGTIKHVMSGVNPQGCQVFSFKKPSSEDLAHNFLWRYMKSLPERGRIGIFNRSYYEDVLVTKVHPELLSRGVTDGKKVNKKFWDKRYEDINAFERHLVRNGTLILKFFLNVSKEEQKARFMERLSREEKHWKFSTSDLAERGHWDEYMGAYQDAIAATSTKWAPWYVVPADYKWITRAVVADVVTTAIRGLDCKYPEVTPEHHALLEEARKKLGEE